MIPGDKHYYSGTDVLQNHFGIVDPATAKSLEYKFTSARELELRESPIMGDMDFEHLQAIHKHLFADMYSWAGQVRDIDFAKRNAETKLVTQFAATDTFEAKIADINAFLASKKQLRGLTKVEFVKSITELHTKINGLSPFREGNGRAARVYLSQLAERAGFRLDLSKIDKARWDLISSTAQRRVDPKNPNEVHHGAQMAMREVFHEALKPTPVHAFQYESRETTLKLYRGMQHIYENLAKVAASTNARTDLTPGEKEQSIALQKLRMAQKLASSQGQILADRPASPFAALHALKAEISGLSTSQEARAQALAKVDVLKAELGGLGSEASGNDASDEAEHAPRAGH